MNYREALCIRPFELWSKKMPRPVTVSSSTPGSCRFDQTKGAEKKAVFKRWTLRPFAGGTSCAGPMNQRSLSGPVRHPRRDDFAVACHWLLRPPRVPAPLVVHDDVHNTFFFRAPPSTPPVSAASSRHAFNDDIGREGRGATASKSVSYPPNSLWCSTSLHAAINARSFDPLA